MVEDIIKLWDKNKSHLEQTLKSTKIDYSFNYTELVKLVIKCILNKDSEETYDSESITKVDNGDYQGTLLYIIPKDSYQPGSTDYITTYVEYGSCSGCDTILSIIDYVKEDKLDEDQLKQMMLLALHLIQEMKFFR